GRGDEAEVPGPHDPGGHATTADRRQSTDAPGAGRDADATAATATAADRDASACRVRLRRHREQPKSRLATDARGEGPANRHPRRVLLLGHVDLELRQGLHPER